LQKHRKHHGDYHKDDHEKHERMEMGLTIQNITTSITGSSNLTVGTTVVYT
jgi:hypothetical protein